MVLKCVFMASAAPAAGRWGTPGMGDILFFSPHKSVSLSDVGLLEAVDLRWAVRDCGCLYYLYYFVPQVPVE